MDDDKRAQRSRQTRYRAQIGRGDLTLAEFERIVDEALHSLPKRFADMVRNVVISVEEEPSAEDRETLGPDADEHEELLGIYRGVALTEREHGDPLLPDEIAVFRGPILRVTRTRREAVDEVRETIVHELGHYFGLGDQEMDY
ncbi:MAG TPA: metallopeptidase family protein [Candidatus Elarobacter sp.]|jgi:predicted Zn-dependent protease with MMP-like domain|nr:metallopeptidase family protein [Candidatus Elarobacter sp.]